MTCQFSSHLVVPLGTVRLHRNSAGGTSIGAQATTPTEVRVEANVFEPSSINVDLGAIVIKGIKVASFNTRTTQITLFRMVDGHVATFGPDAFTAQLLSGAKRVAIAGAAVANGV